MSASASRPARFIRRSRPEDRTRIWRIDLTDEERAIVEADAAALGMSFDDYVVMRLLYGLEDHGHA